MKKTSGRIVKSGVAVSYEGGPPSAEDMEAGALRDRMPRESWGEYRAGLNRLQWLHLCELTYQLGLSDVRGCWERYIPVSK